MIIGLFVLVGLWTLVAAWQDIRTTVVANWITLSLIPTVLVYRLLFGAAEFVDGLVGLGIMVLLTLGLYYGRVFGGADAKLLWGYGAALPWELMSGVSGFLGVVLGVLGFVLVLFVSGMVWSLVWGLWLVHTRRERFRQEMRKVVLGWKRLLIGCGLLAVVFGFLVGFWAGFLFLILGLVWVYAHALDKTLVVLQRPEDLIEGDWLKEKVRVRGRWMVPTAHGLSLSQIAALQKAKKSVVIQQGAPFIPGFLLAFLVTVLWFLGYFGTLSTLGSRLFG